MDAYNPEQLENYTESAEKNKWPILEKLQEHLSAPGMVLEIGSGSGQHALFFSDQLPHLRWQAVETADKIAGLRENIDRHAATRLPEPLCLDVQSSPWPVRKAEYIFSANTLHIMPPAAVEDFFAGAGRTLPPGGLLCIYGAVRYNDAFTAESNARFNSWLKKQNPAQGLRNIEWLSRLAEKNQLTLLADYPMPSNNQFLVWQRNG